MPDRKPPMPDRKPNAPEPYGDDMLSPREREDAQRLTARGHGGQSAGGDYPNPHSGKEGGDAGGGYEGHGGQTEIAYHGPEQLGERTLRPNPNAPAGSESDSDED